VTYKRRLWGTVAGVAIAGAAALAAAPALATTHESTTAHTIDVVQSAAGGLLGSQADWPSAGQNNGDTHNNPDEHIVGVNNVSKLAPKWTFTTAGDISATATVAAGEVFVPDWGGKLWAIDAATGKAIWSKTITSYDGIPGDVSRTSPAYYDGEIVTGTGAQTIRAMDGAYVVGINALTGKMLWRAEASSNPAAVITSSPTVDDGVVYVGTSSKDEDVTAPTFRGSIMALNARTGKILWRTYIVPPGYTGGAVWGSQPVVDHQTGMLYIGTGNNYSVPSGVCSNPDQTGCTPPSGTNLVDSLVGLSLRTGHIEWSHPTLTADTWTVYEPGRSPDFDFGADPNLYTTVIDGKPAQLLGIGQKSGVYYALNPVTGKTVWQTQAGPGGSLGGIEWGTATNGQQVFVAEANGDHKEYTITSYDGKKATTTGGLFAALNAATGKIEWQVADPQGKYLDDSFVSSANGVMYAGSTAATGKNMYAFDSKTGKLLWSYASGGAEFAGASIVGGTVYWGSGYHTEYLGLGYPGDNNKLYAFTLGGH
jgi:polyvinyl alcohol dehydrogenase (cytochrome)